MDEGKNHNSASKIDRFLHSVDWEDSLLLVKQSLLPRIGSDHNPILLTYGDLELQEELLQI